VIDQELVAAAIVNGPHLAADDAVGPAEKTNHALNIGSANPRNRGQNCPEI